MPTRRWSGSTSLSILQFSFLFPFQLQKELFLLVGTGVRTFWAKRTRRKTPVHRAQPSGTSWGPPGAGNFVPRGEVPSAALFGEEEKVEDLGMRELFDEPDWSRSTACWVESMVFGSGPGSCRQVAPMEELKGDPDKDKRPPFLRCPRETATMSRKLGSSTHGALTKG